MAIDVRHRVPRHDDPEVADVLFALGWALLEQRRFDQADSVIRRAKKIHERAFGSRAPEVANDRVAHAYLFAGPRGVGKTTAARVLAMALNCQQRTAEGEPCGICESCERIWSLHSLLSVYERQAIESRPCPHCGAYTLSCCPEPEAVTDESDAHRRWSALALLGR